MKLDRFKRTPFWGVAAATLVAVALTTWILYAIQIALIGEASGRYVRPYGIGYVIPIALLTLLFGIRCGVTALGLSILSSIFVLMAPRFSLAVTNSRDFTELVFLAVVGLLTVAGVNAMRQNGEMLEAMRQATEAMETSNRQQQVFFRDVLSSVTDQKLRLCVETDELPLCTSLIASHVPIDETDVRTLRVNAGETASTLGFHEIRCQDLMTAVGEASMNAVVHAGGGEGRVCVTPKDTVQVWIEDHGQGITLDRLPRATLERGHSTAGTLGHGFWLMLKMVDRMWLMTGSTGTTVVLEQDRNPTEPIWA